LVANWEFNGDWTASNDSNYDLNPAGGAQLVVSPFGSSASFGGGVFPGPNSVSEPRADSVAQPTSSSFAEGLSITARILPVISTTQSVAGIVAHDTSGGGIGSVGFALGINYSDSSFFLQLRDTSDRRLFGSTSANSASGSTWQSIAVTWDGTLTGGIQFYIDGLAVSTSISLVGAFQGLDGGSLPIRIGGSFDDSIYNSYAFDGQIDCAAVWRGAIGSSATGGSCASVPEPSGLSIFGIALLGILTYTQLLRGTRAIPLTIRNSHIL
jgi:hypothetical protein